MFTGKPVGVGVGVGVAVAVTERVGVGAAADGSPGRTRNAVRTTPATTIAITPPITHARARRRPVPGDSARLAPARARDTTASAATSTTAVTR